MAIRWRADLVSHNAKGLMLQIEHEAFLLQTVTVFCIVGVPWNLSANVVHYGCQFCLQCDRSRVILHVTEVGDWRHLLRIWSEYSSEDHQRRLHRFCNSKNARRFGLGDNPRIYTKQWSIALYQNQVIYILKSNILDIGSPIFVLVNTV